jgi:hypothetical protein
LLSSDEISWSWQFHSSFHFRYIYHWYIYHVCVRFLFPNLEETLEIWSSYSGVAEDPGTVGCNTVLMGR